MIHGHLNETWSTGRENYSNLARGPSHEDGAPWVTKWKHCSSWSMRGISSANETEVGTRLGGATPQT